MDPREPESNFDGEPNDLQHFPSARNEEDDASQPLTGDGASPGKIFIGGLARETTSAQFVMHFGSYGEIIDSVIMKDRKTGQPRGFGFITYADPSVVDKVIQDTHVINGKQVEIKRTIPKGAIGSKDFKTKKIFVGGIPASVSEDELKEFFSNFGEVKEHQIMRDYASNRSRGFGFITFSTEEAVDDLLVKGNKIEFAGTKVELKKAEPKKPNPPPSSRRYHDSKSEYGGGFGDSYGGYGGGGFGPGAFRAGGGYGSRASVYGGYGGGDFGGYGGYGGNPMGSYRGDPTFGFSGRYGGSSGGFDRGYNMGGGYGGPGDGHGGYGGGGGGGGFGSSYYSGLGSGGGGGYGGGASSSLYGTSRGGFNGTGSGRYHPYAR